MRNDEWFNSVGVPDEMTTESVGAGTQQLNNDINAMTVSDESVGQLFDELFACSSWVRKHRKPRQALFTPMKVAKGPIRDRQVSNLRVSFFQDVVSKDWKVWVDIWKVSSPPPRKSRIKPWIYCIFM